VDQSVSRSFPLTQAPTTMDSNPHVQRLLQSEDDPSRVSESLGRLQLEEPADDDTNPSMHTRSTLPSTQPKISIPDGAFRSLCKHLERNI
jgi:hypothetical protein